MYLFCSPHWTIYWNIDIDNDMSVSETLKLQSKVTSSGMYAKLSPTWTWGVGGRLHVGGEMGGGTRGQCRMAVISYFDAKFHFNICITKSTLLNRASDFSFPITLISLLFNVIELFEQTSLSIRYQMFAYP